MSAQAFTLLFGLPFVWLYYQYSRTGATADRQFDSRWALWLILAAGLLLRLPLLWDSGFHYDIGTYKAWALKLSDPARPLAIYEPGYFADYPPLYMYVLAALGWLARALDLDSGSGFTALIKLPALLADLAVTLLIWRHGVKLGGAAALAAGLYWLNPAVAFDSALWGQTDSLLALLLVLAWQHWHAGRLWAASLALGAAVAFKPQGLIFAFVYGLTLLLTQPLRTSLSQAVIGLASFTLIIWPFARDQSLDWIFRLYFSTAETYDYLTVNAYNLWAALGLNWSRGEQLVLGLELQIWAMLLAATALVAVAGQTARCLRSATASRPLTLAWCFGLAAMLFFMLAPRMHERYLLSLLPMLALLTLHRPGLRWLLALWTGVALANLAYVYHYYVGLDKVAPADTATIRMIAGGMLLAGGMTLLAWLAPRWLQDRLDQSVRAWRRLPALAQRAPEPGRFSWPHGLSLLLLTLAALVIGSFQLGAQDDYPRSGTRLQDTRIMLHYAKPVQPATVLIYAGHGQATFQLVHGDSGRSLIEPVELKAFYQLHELSVPPAAATDSFQIVIGGEAPDLEINELALLDAAGRPLPPAGLSGSAGQLPRLVDEPGSWRTGRGYRASSFFDEIYHGRTAYEFLQRLPVYETTHPPLGKWLIAQGISVFGMTPFGMRIAGVIATALVVTALAWGGWLLAPALRTIWLVGLLGLFEFSRFSIGRYATIDAFLILFLLLSALFLWRSFCRPELPSARDGWRLGPDLLLAGAWLGAAIAVKWSGLYFGLGVFAWFVWSLLRGGGPGRPHMLIGASLAFGLLPLAIYYLSYLPFMRCLPDAPSLFSARGLQEFWSSQHYMFGYHSNLKDSHAFASPWYSWPLLLKPLWLYRDANLSGLRSSITLLGNPLIWWTGLLALIALLGRKLAWPARDRLWLLGLVGCLYLPWVGVSRASFIYHYYPVVPFLILLLGVTLSRWPAHRQAARYIPPLFVGLAGLLFAAFFPAISGLAVPETWSAALRWLPGWWML